MNVLTNDQMHSELSLRFMNIQVTLRSPCRSMRVSRDDGAWTIIVDRQDGTQRVFDCPVRAMEYLEDAVYYISHGIDLGVER